MALTLTLDKAQYNVGDKVTLTVLRAVAPHTVTITVTEQDGASATAPLKIVEGLVVSDTGPHVWAVVSDDGTTAVYTTTA